MTCSRRPFVCDAYHCIRYSSGRLQTFVRSLRPSSATPHPHSFLVLFVCLFRRLYIYHICVYCSALLSVFFEYLCWLNAAVSFSYTFLTSVIATTPSTQHHYTYHHHYHHSSLPSPPLGPNVVVSLSQALIFFPIFAVSELYQVPLLLPVSWFLRRHSPGLFDPVSCVGNSIEALSSSFPESRNIFSCFKFAVNEN